MKVFQSFASVHDEKCLQAWLYVMETTIVDAVLRFENEPGATMDFNKQS